MNGVKILSAEVGSPEWDRCVASCKFTPNPEFSRNRFGRIMLTDHGAEVWFRNFRLRRPEPVDASDE